MIMDAFFLKSPADPDNPAVSFDKEVLESFQQTILGKVLKLRNPDDQRTSNVLFDIF